MLKVFTGNDLIATREEAYKAARKLVDFETKLQVIDGQNYEPRMCSDLSSGVSLFGERFTYMFDTPSDDEEFIKDVFSNLEDLVASSHNFILIEPNLKAEHKKVLNKFSVEISEFKKTADKPFNVFTLAEALSRKDKKTLWMGLNEAWLSGVETEPVVGTLWWQLKTLRLANLTNSAEEAGLKEFPYKKAKSSLQNFKVGEIDELSAKLLDIHTESRQGGVELPLALERFVLKL